MILFKIVRVHKRPFDPWFDRECRISKCLRKSLERIYRRAKGENDLASWPDKKHSTKNGVNKSLGIFVKINLVIQKTKRLTFGTTLIVPLVKEKDFLLMKFSLLTSKFFF